MIRRGRLLALLLIGLWPLAARGADDRRTVTAVRAPAPIVLDGSLDEDIWRTTAPAAGFIQYDRYSMCNHCAIEYEAARLRGVVGTPGQFVRDKHFGEADYYVLPD